MSGCEQELCPNWSGDGNVCPCAVFGIERKAPRRCPFCGALDDENEWCCDEAMDAALGSPGAAP